MFKYHGMPFDPNVVYSFSRTLPRVEARQSISEGATYEEVQNATLSTTDAVSKEVIPSKEQLRDLIELMPFEAGVQSYLFAVGGFDIVSTSMTGFDGDFPFRRHDKNAINGYFDIETLLMRNEKYVRMMLGKGGFPHEGCVCSTVKDYESAHLDWFRIRREHFVRRMNELYADIWGHIDDKTIEECKARISRSSLSNLKHTLPYLDMV